MPKVLVLGTRNAKKRQEIVEILADLPLELRDLTSYPQTPDVAETGTTFEANARLKAVGVAMALGEWVLGEDSGLVVPAEWPAWGLLGAVRRQARRRCGQQCPVAGGIGPAAGRSPRSLLCMHGGVGRSGWQGRGGDGGPLPWSHFVRGPRPRGLWLRSSVSHSRVPPHFRRIEPTGQARAQPSLPRPGSDAAYSAKDFAP